MKNILYIGNPNSIHDIKWISYFSDKKNYNVYFISEQKCDKNTISKLEGLKIEFLKQIKPFSISNFLQTYKTAKYLKKIIQQKNINLIHILFSTPNSLWGLFIKKPIIITNRGSDALIVLPNILKQGVKGGIFFSLFKKVFKKCIITATSNKQKAVLENLFSIENINVIRTGVNVKEIQKISEKAKTQSNNIIFSPRFFSPIYNISIQIEAITLLPKKIISNYKFIFVEGKKFDIEYSNNIREKLINLKKKLNLNYKIITFLPQQDMFSIYSKSALTIMTPISDGTPNSALEAMSAKCPLIISNLDYDKELFLDTCFVLKENNSKTLAMLIEKSLNSYPNELLEKALEKVNKNGNRIKEMNKIEQLYSSALINNE